MKTIITFLLLAGICIALIFHTNVVDAKHHKTILEEIYAQDFECGLIDLVVVDGYDHLKVKCSNGNQYNVFGRESNKLIVLPATENMFLLVGPLF